MRFGALDAGTFQAAILGAHQSGTLLSTLISRLRPVAAPNWPLLDGTVKADSLILGPVTLHGVSAVLHIVESGAEISGLEAGLLGGRMEGTGSIHTPGNNQDKPAYALSGHFEKLSPQAVGQLLGLRWTGGTIDGDGTVALAGFTDKDLAASAKGNLHFASRRGVMAAESGSDAVPPALARFDHWTADRRNWRQEDRSQAESGSTWRSQKSCGRDGDAEWPGQSDIFLIEDGEAVIRASGLPMDGGGLSVEVSHPSRKSKDAARRGHPGSVEAERGQSGRDSNCESAAPFTIESWPCL